MAATETAGRGPGEVTLDPADWDEVRRLGHRMVDDMVAHIRGAAEGPVWREIPAEVRARFEAPLPLEPAGAASAYEEFRASILPYGLGNLHPRFWGWVIGSGTVTGALAELLTAAMNANAAGFASSAILVEEQVLRWFAALMGMPASTSGLLVTGASEANFVGIAAGLRARLGPAYRQGGVVAAGARPMVYGSEESHFSVWRAVRLLGLGQDSCRIIPSDHAHRIDLEALDAAILADRRQGHRPVMLIGTAGTVGVGAFDPLDAVADRAQAHGLWLHVDGAFGALMALAPELAAPLRGLGRADSLAFDLHKWLHVPIEAACVLVRDATTHRDAFAVESSYTADAETGPATRSNRFTSLGLQQSRSARAIKVWFSLREHGAKRLGACVAMNVAQARYLADRVEADAELELLAPVASQIVCFRAVPASLPPTTDLNRFNRQLLQVIQTRGLALPSGHTVRGTFGIRCSITNHRTTRRDLDAFLALVRATAAEVAAGWGDDVHTPVEVSR